MRLSSLSDYAVVMMSAAARHAVRMDGGERLSASSLAGETGVPLPTAQKLMGKLAASGLLVSARGAGGGFSLARDACDISVADIVEAVEGPIAMTNCVEPAKRDCGLGENCRVKPHWTVVNAAVKGALAGVTLAVLAGEVMA